MHKMMAIDGQDLENFGEASERESISFSSEDHDPALVSEEENEEEWSHGKNLTTLMLLGT
jgi:hypothetical protein